MLFDFQQFKYVNEYIIHSCWIICYLFKIMEDQFKSKFLLGLVILIVKFKYLFIIIVNLMCKKIIGNDQLLKASDNIISICLFLIVPTVKLPKGPEISGSLQIIYFTKCCRFIFSDWRIKIIRIIVYNILSQSFIINHIISNIVLYKILQYVFVDT